LPWVTASGVPLFGLTANPVDASWNWDGSIGLDGNPEVLAMPRIDQGNIQLKQGLAAGAHDKSFS
jgi:hypothetical protein